ncbi:MAG TPA: glycosyltransferase family 2 protein [Caulobacteraceae bacterium]|nr:glycosyltransferase family 2 protein [Caulobacteraceae bacterium]
MTRVSVIIPTQRRPGPLETAARSVLLQQGVDLGEMEMVVVDNDQMPSAAGFVAKLAGEAPFPVRYVHEPSPGVANARNAAMEAAQGELIAFLDDDEEAPPTWLAALLRAQLRYGADVVFGPVLARADWAKIKHPTYLERFFSRVGPAESGVIDHYYGCGDSLVRRAALPDPKRPFSAVRNQIGGEDDLLFGAMEGAGAKFAWASEAWVWEDPVPDRLTLGYALLRAFAFGQGATAHCAAAGDRLGVARWMAMGVAQAAAYALIAAAQRAVRSERFVFSLDRAARGLGKTLWWKPFKIRFYGKRSSAQAIHPGPRSAAALRTSAS